MNQDYKDLLSAFHSHGVEYLVVDGFAVIYHAQPRFTKDLDLFISTAPANAKAIHASLSDFGAPLQGIDPNDFTDRKNFFRFGREPKGIDILPDIPGVRFDAAWGRRIAIVVDAATGQKANFISADDLIASKMASGRPQDLADAWAIQQALGLGSTSEVSPQGD